MATSFTPMLERWSDGLAIGLVAQALGMEVKAGPEQATFRNVLRESLNGLLSPLWMSEPTFMRRLPVSTVRSLSNKSLIHRHEDGTEIVERARHALHFLTGLDRENIPPRLSSARLMAHLCLEGGSSSARLVRAGMTFLGSAWRHGLNNDGWQEVADAHLRRLRGHEGMVRLDTFGLTEELQRLILSSPINENTWTTISHVIFHQLFSWPLLIDPSESPRYNCFALPVAIDLSYDGRSRAIVELGDNDEVSLRIKWESELLTSMDVAKRLYISKHGRLFTGFREQVEKASVVFDFSLAARTLSRTPFDLTLFDHSMVPYFSQVILHRLLGRRIGFGATVIGTLGELRLGPGGRGIQVGLSTASGSARKLAQVFKDELFTKAVLSQAESGDIHLQAKQATADDNAFTEVNFCHSMANVADAVQIDGWRQAHYERCPDVHRLMHSAHEELLPPDHASVRAVGECMRGAAGCVLRLPDSIDALAFFSYLHHVNNGERLAMAPRTPPALSWTAIRAALDEDPQSFWHAVWNTFGTRHEDFSRFMHAPSNAYAATRLANALNTFTPSEVCPSHMAPDLLVILDGAALDGEEGQSADAGRHAPMWQGVLAELGANALLPSPIEPLRRFIGVTRIVVIGSGRREVKGRSLPQTAPSDSRYQTVIEALRVFRFGFTQQTARMYLSLLDYDGERVRDVLMKLRRSRRLEYASGRYWVAGSIGDDASESWPSDIRRRRHWAAANALAPYMAPMEGMGKVELGTSFAPAAVQEALYHVDIARKLEAEWLGALPLNHPARIGHSVAYFFKGRLLAHLAYPSTHNILAHVYSLSLSNATWDLAREQLAEKGALGIEPSAEQIIVYARAALRRLMGLAQDPQTLRARQAEMLTTVRGLYERALSKRDVSPSVRLGLLTHYGFFLQAYGRYEPQDPAALAVVREEIADLVGRNVVSPFVLAEWFEVEGDACADPKAAANQYRLATRMVPFYFTCWVKLLGVEPDQVNRSDAVAEMRSSDILDLAVPWARARRLPLPTGLGGDVVHDRWKRGLADLLALSPQVPALQPSG